MTEVVDTGRRHFLTVATVATGAVGAAFVAVPFLASWKPSARARALGAPVEVDISKLEAGAVRQFGEISTDEGKSWKPFFDFTYKPSRAPN